MGLGLTREAWRELVATWGHSKFRGDQVFEAVFRKGIGHASEISTLAHELRAKIDAEMPITPVPPAQVQVSTDGTRKYQFSDGAVGAYEAVYIPEVAAGRGTNTLCVSSQTGCAVGCKFCFTASIKRHRDLTAGEIIGQVLAVRADLLPQGPGAQITNIVFMGMGEPLLNFDNVVQACKVMLEPMGLSFSTRRITVSTSGIVPRIDDLGRAVNTQLAISLNATTDEIRTKIMPINKKWPIAELLGALRRYPLAPRRRFTIEYVLLKDINDSVEDAQRLAKLLDGIPVKINLLPLNAHNKTPFETPSRATVARFQEELRKRGYGAWLRTPRGQDIAAACGQLGEAVLPTVLQTLPAA